VYAAQRQLRLPVEPGGFPYQFDDEEPSVQTITPLEAVELQPGDRFLIVTCDYRLADKTEGSVDLEDRFVLSANTVGFHLIAALPPP